jgi:predicted RNA-binding protein YlqC (UPF0109 family)
METFTDKEFVSYVVKAIVDNPNDVLIERTVDEMGVLITLQVNPSDMGYVIGKSGSTAKAIRSLLRIVGARNNARVNLKILEPEQGAKKESILNSSEQVDKLVDDLDI